MPINMSGTRKYLKRHFLNSTYFPSSELTENTILVHIHSDIPLYQSSKSEIRLSARKLYSEYSDVIIKIRLVKFSLVFSECLENLPVVNKTLLR